jgi:hypothetical protein
MDESPKQFAKADGPIRQSFEPDSKVTDERAEHSAKQERPSCPTAAGRQIEGSEEHFANAKASIEPSFEPGAKTTSESESQ